MGSSHVVRRHCWYLVFAFSPDLHTGIKPVQVSSAHPADISQICQRGLHQVPGLDTKNADKQ